MCAVRHCAAPAAIPKPLPRCIVDKRVVIEQSAPCPKSKTLLLSALGLPHRIPSTTTALALGRGAALIGPGPLGAIPRRRRGDGLCSKRPEPTPWCLYHRARRPECAKSRWRLCRSTHIEGIATDHGATARVARSTPRALSDLAASGLGANDASGGHGEQPTLRYAFSERLASLAVRWAASLDDDRSANANARRRTQRLPSLPASGVHVAHHARTQNLPEATRVRRTEHSHPHIASNALRLAMPSKAATTAARSRRHSIDYQARRGSGYKRGSVPRSARAGSSAHSACALRLRGELPTTTTMIVTAMGPWFPCVWPLLCAGPRSRHFCAWRSPHDGQALTCAGPPRLDGSSHSLGARNRVGDRPLLRRAHDHRVCGPYFALGRDLANWIWAPSCALRAARSIV